MLQSPENLAPPSAAAAKPSRGMLYKGWHVVAVAAVGYFLTIGPLMQSFGAFSVAFQRDLGGARTYVSLIFSIMVIMTNASKVVVGEAMDRFPIRPLMVMGSIGMAAAFWLASRAQAMIWLLVLYGFVMPMMLNFASALPSASLIMTWFERRRALAIGIAMLGIAVSAIVFPPLTGWLIERYGWRSALAMYGLAILPLIPLTMTLRGPREGETAIEKMGAHPDEIVGADRQIPIVRLITLRSFWKISVGIGAMLGVTSAIVVSIVSIGVGQGLSLIQAGNVASVLGVGAMLGKIGISVLADRRGYHLATIVSLGITAAGLVVLTLPGLAALIAGAFLIGLIQGGMMPLWHAQTRQAFGGATFGRALGYTSVAMIPWTLLMPMLAGFSHDRLGSYGPAWLIMAAIALASLGFVCLGQGTHRAAVAG